MSMTKETMMEKVGDAINTANSEHIRVSYEAIGTIVIQLFDLNEHSFASKLVRVIVNEDLPVVIENAITDYLNELTLKYLKDRIDVSFKYAGIK